MSLKGGGVGVGVGVAGGVQATTRWRVRGWSCAVAAFTHSGVGVYPSVHAGPEGPVAPSAPVAPVSPFGAMHAPEEKHS